MKNIRELMVRLAEQGINCSLLFPPFCILCNDKEDLNMNFFLSSETKRAYIYFLCGKCRKDYEGMGEDDQQSLLRKIEARIKKSRNKLPIVHNGHILTTVLEKLGF